MDLHAAINTAVSLDNKIGPPLKIKDPLGQPLAAAELFHTVIPFVNFLRNLLAA
ncbi:hypothetical protein D3C78_829790 [compost metagenome]